MSTQRLRLRKTQRQLYSQAAAKPPVILVRHAMPIHADADAWEVVAIPAIAVIHSGVMMAY
jgi:hypothetical protein